MKFRNHDKDHSRTINSRAGFVTDYSKALTYCNFSWLQLAVLIDFIFLPEFLNFRRIAGLNERKAMEIIAWRKRNGTFRSREQLKQVRGIGDKTFEQCAGFVRIFQRSPEIISLSTDDDDDDDGNGERSKDNEEEKVTGKRKAAKSGSSSRKKRKHTPSLITFNKLDSTSIHPESYETAKK